MILIQIYLEQDIYISIDNQLKEIPEIFLGGLNILYYMRKLYQIVIAMILLSSISLDEVKAQQDAQFTQYVYNTISVNPAYAGSRGVFSITGLHRSQWVGLDGAPRTQTLSLNTNFRYW